MVWGGSPETVTLTRLVDPGTGRSEAFLGVTMNSKSRRNVDKVVEGLRAFSDITGGTFPSSLDMMTVMKESTKVLMERLGIDKDAEPDAELAKELAGKMMTLQMPAVFYARLGQESKDPAYYGDKVTTKDTGAVLLRWKVSETGYQVIFGDLTTRNVTPEQLAELEKASAP